jgi:hypothetical protein
MGRQDERSADFEIDGRRGLEQPPERLGGGGRRPAVAGIVIVVLVGIALWQPWAPSRTPLVAPGAPTPGAALVEPSSRPSPAAASPASSGAPTPAPNTTRTRFYTTVTDNEWTIVALLAPGVPGSTEEPATQHPAAWSADGPFLVLQQGLTPRTAPAVGTALSPTPCPPASRPRDRTSVPLPAGRVAYLGITVPSGVSRPDVTASMIGSTQGALVRLPAPAIRLAGMDAATRYVIPTAGPGAAILFAGDATGAMAPGAYQFTVASPGSGGNRYLYACIPS